MLWSWLRCITTRFPSSTKSVPALPRRPPRPVGGFLQSSIGMSPCPLQGGSPVVATVMQRPGAAAVGVAVAVAVAVVQRQLVAVQAAEQVRWFPPPQTLPTLPSPAPRHQEAWCPPSRRPRRGTCLWALTPNVQPVLLVPWSRGLSTRVRWGRLGATPTLLWALAGLIVAATEAVTAFWSCLVRCSAARGWPM